MGTFFRITMQSPLFELKLKTFPLFHRRDHFVFTRRFLKVITFCNYRYSNSTPNISSTFRYFETYNVTEVYLHWKRGKIDEGLSCLQN